MNFNEERTNITHSEKNPIIVSMRTGFTLTTYLLTPTHPPPHTHTHLLSNFQNSKQAMQVIWMQSDL